MAIFFLVYIASGLAIAITWLGWVTVHTNLLGWFLLLVGISYLGGVVVVYGLRRERFWESRDGGSTLDEEQSDRSFWMIVLGMLAAFFLPPVEYIALPKFLPRTGWMQMTGLILIMLGVILFIWARRALGKFYSGHVSVMGGQPLVQRGPYRYIRHPAYAGYLLMTFGLVLGYSSIAGLAVILGLLLPGLVYRINVEEKMLAEHFGAQFKAYARGTARLIPRIW
jgi:protein-S-isoprenylcysteine O-methyltransferase Ste14